MTTDMTKEQAAQFYGKTGREWLTRWDEGRTVWSVEMGGLGPGYEQCIQITTAEILRHLLAVGYDAERWAHREKWSQDRDAIEKAVFAVPVVKDLGLSGAQWGGAMSLGTVLYKRGPLAFLDAEVKDRLIQVSRTFPSMATVGPSAEGGKADADGGR